MKKQEHKKRHIELHEKLDELMADYIDHTGKFISRTLLTELMEWSFEQTKNPTEKK